MPSAALPPDEAERIATLRGYRILDSLPDERFDRLTALAAQHFGVPMALISLIDSARQWFKSSVGFAQRETERDHAFCAHAILAPDAVTVVHDATQDPRFANNPLVLGPDHIRFYAGAPILAPNGQPLGTLCILDREPRAFSEEDRHFLTQLAANASDLFDLHLSHLTLAEAATRDPLTRLANRRQLEAAMDTAMEAAFAGRPFALLTIDLDGFRAINNKYGDEAGDDVLSQIGQRLSSSIRASDVPARIGGDEFAIILSDPVSHEIVSRVAQRLIADINAPIEIEGAADGRPVVMSASVGCALALRHGTTPAEVRRSAKEAMYMAKREGRNRLVIADEVVPLLGNASYNTIEHRLGEAIAQDQLKLQWQPYFLTGEGRLTGYEALVRWTCPGLGPVVPSTFIPVAEASGLIGALDEWVLRAACKAALEIPEQLTISVNLSAYWFSREELVPLVKRVLSETGLTPQRLILELTERTIITHDESARHSMESLRELGVGFALDDFGTSYSSLNYLRKLPFDRLKLDRSFVGDLGADRQAEAVAGAIVQLGHALGMSVCAEGVETPLQLGFLNGASCDLVQGYLLGRPDWEPMSASTPVAAFAKA
ncbi:putative bifunctional diguanylate cyclase/phosphodiesterase [Novosphingobium terrae]|uniref:putative bifunctional diguanylate cyclase/phosphodiesterase n=1 Tax=Novosphingobium terrae TaxID=2726189 RepID=UPI00197EF5D1|nr:sensor domain-containing phosphodiesterase [Novosphingobium terrae]